jgi:internalin A
MPTMKKISTFLGLSISFASVLPVISAQGQPVKTKSFTQWCQSKMSVSVETRETINLLLKKAGTNNCKTANSKLRRLTKLSLASSQISDVKPLASLSNLTFLDLSYNEISGVKPLASLSNLTILNLMGNKISDVKPLASLSSLTHLKLMANEIVDVKPLVSLSNLTYLNLSYNEIVDVKPLFSLSNLTYLNLGGHLNKLICPVKPEEICHF